MSAPGLTPPAARQGPGPISPALLQALDVSLTRLVTRALPGDQRAAAVGAGTELAQLRQYVSGDDVRHLDASATARTRDPHVRLHVPERALTTWIALDVSPSMAFGTARRLKADVAEGVALAFGRLGVRRAGSVGAVAFGGGATRVLSPRAAKPGTVALGRLLTEGVAVDGHHDPRGLAGALERIARLTRRPGLVVVISDFRDQDGWVAACRSLRIRHALLAVEIGDPRESRLPASGRLNLRDPETGAHLEVNTSRRGVRERFAELERRRSVAIRTELRRLRVPHVTLSTDEDWLIELGRRLR